MNFQDPDVVLPFSIDKYIDLQKRDISSFPNDHFPGLELIKYQTDDAIFLAIKGNKKFDPDQQNYVYNFFGEDYIENLYSAFNIDKKYVQEDMMMYPLNPKANLSTAATLILSARIIPEVEKMTPGDGYYEKNIKFREDRLRETLPENLKSVNFDFYSTYDLFFLCTRFYTRPMDEKHYLLASMKRNLDFYQRMFIDTIFSQDLDYEKVLEMLNGDIQTPFNDWVFWGLEYYQAYPYRDNITEIDMYRVPSEIAADWKNFSDNDIISVINIPIEELPDRKTSHTRSEWLVHMAETYLYASNL